MIEGKKITMAELTARHLARVRSEIAERDAWHATPEGAAEKAERDAYEARMRIAEARYAEENQPDLYEDGRAANLNDQKREAPDDLSDEDAEKWLEGWDSQGLSDD